PREMVAMFRASVVPKLEGLVTGAHRQILLRTHGLPESEVNDRLAGIEAEYGVTLGYRATFPVIEVKVRAEAADREEAEARARAAADAARERLGVRVVFAEGDVHFAEAVGKALVDRGLRLGCAESCTGGLVGQLLTERSGA